MNVVILKTAIKANAPIFMVTNGSIQETTEKQWKQMRTHISTFANFCNKFIFNGYVFGSGEGDKNIPARIAPLHSEMHLLRGRTPHRNIMAVIYENGKIMGYILAEEKGTEVHLDVICAKPGYGKILMQAFVKEFSHKNIRLNALSNVLSYYQQYGFHFGEKCGDARMHYLDQLAKSVAPGSFDSTTLEHAYETLPELRRLLNSLKSERLNVHEANCSAKNKSCFAVDGFKMIRCRTRRRRDGS
jgi:hypothetical protein